MCPASLLVWFCSACCLLTFTKKFTAYFFVDVLPLRHWKRRNGALVYHLALIAAVHEYSEVVEVYYLSFYRYTVCKVYGYLQLLFLNFVEKKSWRLAVWFVIFTSPILILAQNKYIEYIMINLKFLWIFTARSRQVILGFFVRPLPTLYRTSKRN